MVILNKSSDNKIIYKKIVYFDDPQLSPSKTKEYSKLVKKFNDLIMEK